jgi:hypothetical protein
MKSSNYLLVLVSLTLMVACNKDSNNSLLNAFNSRSLGAVDIMEYSGSIEIAVKDGDDSELDLMNYVALQFAMALTEIACSEEFSMYLPSNYDTTEGVVNGFLSFEEIRQSFSEWSQFENFITNQSLDYEELRDSLWEIGYECALYIPNFDNCNWSLPPVILVGAEVDTSDYENYIPGWYPIESCDYFSYPILFASSEDVFEFEAPILIVSHIYDGEDITVIDTLDTREGQTQCENCLDNATKIYLNKIKLMEFLDKGNSNEISAHVWTRHIGFHAWKKHPYEYNKFTSINKNSINSEHVVALLLADYMSFGKNCYPFGWSFNGNAYGSENYILLFEHDWYATSKRTTSLITLLNPSTFCFNVQPKIKSAKASDFYTELWIRLCAEHEEQCQYDNTKNGNNGYVTIKGWTP